MRLPHNRHQLEAVISRLDNNAVPTAATDGRPHHDKSDSSLTAGPYKAAVSNEACSFTDLPTIAHVTVCIALQQNCHAAAEYCMFAAHSLTHLPSSI